ncbi:glycosyltransferase family 4 protein [Oceanobacillus jordanicus]|uniref:Glycosyltransferase family 4 protein n=1 Tax=Oceanobacillus jordanicus TaxID=2867266 RepID=A0AAW5AZY3_9BACI|nr:glycosyltransferase family 4 protein [Oceanobacillus jordanicus]
MNIWIFNHYAVGPNSSGITRHFDLAKELVSLGHNVTIFASSFNHQKREEEQNYGKGDYFIYKEYTGVKFYWLKTTSYYKNDHKRILNMFSYTYKANKLAKKIKEKPDIVIGSLMHPLAAILGYKNAKKKKAKFFFEERDLWPQSLIDLGKISPNNPIVKLLGELELFLYKKADKIIVLFDKAPEYVKQKGIAQEKVIYLPNGVDINRYHTKGELPESHLYALEEQKSKFLLIYTGAHSLANYLEAMVEIAMKIGRYDKNIHFVLIGDGPEKKNMIKKAEENNLKNVTFLPPIQKEFIPTILNYADAGIITMRNAEVYKWGISLNKMFDYMAASLPIFMLSNLKDTVITKHNLGIVTDGIDQISNEILRVSKDPELLQEYSKNSYKYGESNHTWSMLAKKLESHF